MKRATLVAVALMCPTLFVSARQGTAPAPASQQGTGPSDAALAKILEANRSSFDKCVSDLDKQYPEAPPLPSDRPPATDIAEAKRRLDEAMKAVEDATNRLKGEKACTVAYHAVVDLKLKAAGASPQRVSQATSKWFQAYWKAKSAASAP